MGSFEPPFTPPAQTHRLRHAGSRSAGRSSLSDSGELPTPIRLSSATETSYYIEMPDEEAPAAPLYPSVPDEFACRICLESDQTPDDPLIAARQKATDARGGNGFLSVSATHAALLLAQGAGRLLRATDDRGVVAILDPRIATARYGGFLRASLPPFWETTDREKVHGALRRLRESS